LDALEEAFVKGIDTGHPEMPRFIASPDQIADIIAYIGTLKP
jgi:mono/diheme cytochrome c family protein